MAVTVFKTARVETVQTAQTTLTGADLVDTSKPVSVDMTSTVSNLNFPVVDNAVPQASVPSVRFALGPFQTPDSTTTQTVIAPCDLQVIDVQAVAITGSNNAGDTFVVSNPALSFPTGTVITAGGAVYTASTTVTVAAGGRLLGVLPTAANAAAYLDLVSVAKGGVISTVATKVAHSDYLYWIICQASTKPLS